MLTPDFLKIPVSSKEIPVPVVCVLKRALASLNVDACRDTAKIVEINPAQWASIQKNHRGTTKIVEISNGFQYMNIF